MTSPPTVAVLGSCIVDTVSYVRRFPSPGQTVVGRQFSAGCGGKGANQAVAAARLGASVQLVGKVGNDLFGRFYLDGLSKTGVNYEHVSTSIGRATGVAVITVEDGGENCIVIVPGANLDITTENLRDAEAVITQSAILVCQCEVTMAVTKDALRLARRHGVKTLMNAAPAIQDMDHEIIKLSDIFCVNETEGQAISGREISNAEQALSVCRTFVQDDGCRTAVITLGALGAVFYSDTGESGHVCAEKVNACDCTGAGDAFVGALAYYSVHHGHLRLEEVLRRCCAVASVSVQKAGTQVSFPSRDQLPQSLFQ